MEWNDICARVNKHKNINSDEDRFQELIEYILLALGWSYQDIAAKKSFQIGAANRIMPDIIVSKDDENVIVFELKRPSLEPSQAHISQLTSYLRALGIRFGIYIGQNLQLYHNETSNAKDPQKVLEIDFIKDDDDAKKLIVLLRKDNFSKDSFEKFCKDMIERNQEEEEEEDANFAQRSPIFARLSKQKQGKIKLGKSAASNVVRKIGGNAGSGIVRQVNYGETFRTIAELCNECFGTDYQGNVQQTYFIPKTLKQKYGSKYILWCPNIAGEPINGWVNDFSNEDIAKEHNTIDKYTKDDELGRGEYAVIFVKDSLRPVRYRFAGVYKFDGFDAEHKRFWKRISKEFPLKTDIIS
jgi:hypothetical protein